MACEDLLTECFFDERAPLAVPELNRERTLKYLECCYRHGLSWDDAKQQIEDFLRQRGVPRQGVVRQLMLANGTFFFSRGSAGIRMRPRHAIRYQLRRRPCMV